MKLLIINPALPYPVNTGGCQAVFNMITELQKTIEVHCLFPINKGDVKRTHEYMSSLNRKEWPNVVFHPFEQKRDLKYKLSKLGLKLYNNFLKSERSSISLNAPSQHFTPEYMNFIGECIANVQPDIIQTESYYVLDFVYLFPKNIKKVFIQHEINYVVKDQILPIERDATLDYLYCRARCEEIMAMNQYDGVVTLTDDDRNKLISDGITAEVYSSPAGIPAPTVRNKCAFNNELIFVGPSGHAPNKEGLEWFLSSVWNDVREKHPSVVLKIVGSWNQKIADKITSSYKGVLFSGFVESLQDAYSGAIAIVPILSGSGMRMKIIDAVNMGSPFISTSIGAEGLMYQDNVDCYIADEPKEFALKLNNLIEIESIRQQFYDNSAKTRDKYYSMKALANRRKEFYHRLLNNK